MFYLQIKYLNSYLLTGKTEEGTGKKREEKERRLKKS